MRIGFCGLGNMGAGIAGLLLDAGHSLTVYNRSGEKADPLVARGAKRTKDPAQAAKGAEVLVTMLADDEATAAVVLGDHGALGSLPEGATHVCSGSISTSLSGRLARAHGGRAQGYVAAPVFGRPDAAAHKQLWIIAAGEPAVVEHVRPVLEAMGRGLTVVGSDPTSANLVKLSGNFLIASAIEALAEAVALLRKAGIDPAPFLAIMGDSLFRSPVYQGYGRAIGERGYGAAGGFALRLGLKDLRLLVAEADAVEAPLPLATLLRDHLLEASARGKGELDWSALGALAAERVGLEP